MRAKFVLPSGQHHDNTTQCVVRLPAWPLHFFIAVKRDMQCSLLKAQYLRLWLAQYGKYFLVIAKITLNKFSEMNALCALFQTKPHTYSCSYRNTKL
uniref:Uncharacterized protein n=1 Tax=Rhipicephalus appendiculatus TaxID=34631 RepID=A0A131YA32_RHIAP